MKSPGQRYAFAFFGFMGCYAGVVIGGPFLDRAFDLPTAVRLALALAPVVPALLAMREFVIFFRSMDEVQARIQSEAILIAAAVVAFASFSWGFVEVWMETPDVSFIWILPAMAATWGLAVPFVARRYR